MLKLEWISWVILRRTWWVRLLSPKPHIDQPLDAYCRQRGCDLEQGHSVQLKSISTEAWEWRALCWQHLPQLGLSANQSNRGFSVVDQSTQYAVFPGPTKTLELSFVSLLTFYPSDLQSTTSATAELHTTIASTLDGLSSILLIVQFLPLLYFWFMFSAIDGVIILNHVRSHHLSVLNSKCSPTQSGFQSPSSFLQAHDLSVHSVFWHDFLPLPPVTT